MNAATNFNGTDGTVQNLASMFSLNRLVIQVRLKVINLIFVYLLCVQVGGDLCYKLIKIIILQGRIIWKYCGQNGTNINNIYISVPITGLLTWIFIGEPGVKGHGEFIETNNIDLTELLL